MNCPYYWRRISGSVLAVCLSVVGCSKTADETFTRNDPASVVSDTERTSRTQADDLDDSIAEVVHDGAEGSTVSAADIPTRLARQKRAMRSQALSPQEDGWNTETLHEATQNRLNQLASVISGQTLSANVLQSFVDRSFQCEPLRPALEVVYEDRNLVVWRASIADKNRRFLGAVGFQEALSDLVSPQAQRRVKFKQYQLASSETTFTTRAFWHLQGMQGRRRIEQNATWRITWLRGDGNSAPLIAEIGVEDYEHVVAKAETPLWVDCTQSVLGPNACYRAQLLYGTAYWRQRLESRMHIPYQGQVGMAMGDVDSDGLEDIYVCQPGGLPNRLFLHRPDGTAMDASHKAGLDLLDYTRSALFVDLDNDGDQDIVLATMTALWVLANDGRGVFEQRFMHGDIRAAYSLAAADFDDDRDLDIYVCRYIPDVEKAGQLPTPIPPHDGNNGAKNFLLRNNGNFQFEDVTEQTGLDVHNRRFSLAAAWEDFDNDHDLDLYVANDFGRNCMYRNDGGRFVEVSAASGLEDTAFGMSVSWADYDRNGTMDLYVGNMFSAAGNRVTFQRQFRPESKAAVKKAFQRTSRGNSLFRNNGNETFSDVSVDLGVTMGRWSWASLFADINNDGWEDLLVSNGFVTGNVKDDL